MSLRRNGVGEIEYQDIIDNGGPKRENVLKCTQRSIQCMDLMAFENQDYIAMVMYILESFA